MVKENVFGSLNCFLAGSLGLSVPNGTIHIRWPLRTFLHTDQKQKHSEDKQKCESKFAECVHGNSCVAPLNEHALVGAKASVMLYDDMEKKWIPGGSSPGISKVNIYHNSANNTFRVVGRKLQDHEVVVNSAIFGGLKYNKATPTFHQWRDSRQVYGLNFISKEDAERFATAMYAALESLTSSKSVQKAVTPLGTESSTVMKQNGVQCASGVSTGVTSGECLNDNRVMNGSVTESNQHMTLGKPPTREEYRAHKRQGSEGRALDLSNIQSDLIQKTCTGPNPAALRDEANINLSQTPPTDSVRDEANCNNIPTPPAPPKAPPPPPLVGMSTPGLQRNIGGKQGPAVPAKSTTPGSAQLNQHSISLGGQNGGAKAPLEPPTPPPISNLASALQSAVLEKVVKPDEPNSSNTPVSGPVSSGRSASISSPLNTDIMSEMQRKLRDRRAKADGEHNSESDGQTEALESPAPVRSLVDSPRVDRGKRFQSLTGQETFHHPVPASSSSNPQINHKSSVTAADLENLKQEIISETRKCIIQAKLDIIEVIRKEMIRQ